MAFPPESVFGLKTSPKLPSLIVEILVLGKSYISFCTAVRKLLDERRLEYNYHHDMQSTSHVQQHLSSSPQRLCFVTSRAPNSYQKPDQRAALAAVCLLPAAADKKPVGTRYELLASHNLCCLQARPMEAPMQAH